MDREIEKIVQNYELYRSLIKECKVTTATTISLTVNDTHTNKYSGTLQLKHSTYLQELYLYLETREQVPQDTAIKIFAEKFSRSPLFRYDGNGGAHENCLDTIPLSEKSVPTPHFHYFHESGILLAYKSNSLRNQPECISILSDANFALAHFCNEAIISASPSLQIAIERTPDMFGTREDDPLSEFGIIGDPL